MEGSTKSFPLFFGIASKLFVIVCKRISLVHKLTIVSHLKLWFHTEAPSLPCSPEA